MNRPQWPDSHNPPSEDPGTVHVCNLSSVCQVCRVNRTGGAVLTPEASPSEYQSTLGDKTVWSAADFSAGRMSDTFVAEQREPIGVY